MVVLGPAESLKSGLLYSKKVSSDFNVHVRALAGSRPSYTSPFVDGGLGRRWSTLRWILRSNVIVFRPAANIQCGYLSCTRVLNSSCPLEGSHGFSARVRLAVCWWGIFRCRPTLYFLLGLNVVILTPAGSLQGGVFYAILV